MQALLPWQRVRVEGLSMSPTLAPGDWLLVRHGAPVRPGALVLARFRSRPDLLVIKRAVAEQDGGWLLASDNAVQGSDSRQYGVADVLATAVRVWHRGGRPVPAGSRGQSAGSRWQSAASGWQSAAGRCGSAARRWWGTPPREFSPPG